MNMKPPEILSLLEEASGTKLYERKKESAMKTLAKKQTKLDEIDEVCLSCNSRTDRWTLGNQQERNEGKKQHQQQPRGQLQRESSAAGFANRGADRQAPNAAPD